MVVIFVDHYTVLGLPTGEKGLQVSTKDIQKAYKLKALELHPDKKPNNPDAAADFQKLRASFDVLKNEHARKVFNHELMIRLKKRREKVVVSVFKDSFESDIDRVLKRKVDEIRRGKRADDEFEEMRRRDCEKRELDRMSSEYEKRYFDREQWDVYRDAKCIREIKNKRSYTLSLHSILNSYSEKR